ncbi:MAG TPA: TetR/AcrR family transcriptional regulator [Gammaproteobacteria bacterium]|nr:TetR/AcrR family transcriptional regulator [Gammaproteobacteria bacterium]
MPMEAHDRRRAILDVVIPLLREKGSSLTTAEIARAANIAEGTIFRVFPDKSAIMFEAVKAAIDATPVADAIRAISPGAPMRTQLVEAAGLLRDYFNRMVALGESLRSGSPVQRGRHEAMAATIKSSSDTISAALAELFARHRAVLRVPPAAAKAAFRGLVFASAHPLLPPKERLALEEAVSILLSGIAHPERN